MNDFPTRMKLGEFYERSQPGWSRHHHRLIEVVGTFVVGALICVVLWLGVLYVGTV